MNLQENIRRILREETSDPIIVALRRRVRDLDWFIWFEVRELDRRQIGGICSFKTPESFIEAVIERVDDGIYWDYFSTFIDDDSEDRAVMYRFIEKFIKDNYDNDLRVHFNITCKEKDMNLQENIRKILREEPQKLPAFVIRRLKGTDFLDLLKSEVMHNHKYYDNFHDNLVASTTEVASAKIPTDFGSDDRIDAWIDALGDYLMDRYGDEVKEYIDKVFTDDVFKNDGYIYAFVKHSERDWESRNSIGSSLNYDTWGELLYARGVGFPIDWWKVKDELNKIGSGEVLFLRPEDESNWSVYYFSIVKKKPEEVNSIYPIKDYKRLEIKL